MRFSDIVDSFTFTRADGRTYRADVVLDNISDALWKNEDWHGSVSEWTTRDKRPGERVLNCDGNRKRYYDFAKTVAIARRDGWDTAPYGQDGITSGQRAARAVEADFQRLKAWCNDEWYYVGVVVTRLTTDGERDTEHRESVWGIESDASNYIRKVAEDIADQIAWDIDARRVKARAIAPRRLRRLSRRVIGQRSARAD